MKMILADSTTQRVHTLAVKHGRSDVAEILNMIELAELMDIQRISFMPGGPGAQLVPVVVVRNPVITRRQEYKE
jgi:hypothetical protein